MSKETHITEAPNQVPSIVRLYQLKDDYNAEFGHSAAWHRSQKRDEEDILLDATIATQSEVSAKMASQAFEKLKEGCADVTEITGMGFSDPLVGKLNFASEEDTPRSSLSTSDTEVVLINGDQFLKYLEGLNPTDMTDDQFLGVECAVSAFNRDISKMYGFSGKTENYQIETARCLERIDQTLQKFKDLRDEEFKIQLANLHTYAEYVSEGTLKEHLLIQHDNLFDEDENIAGPATWANEIGHVEGDGVFYGFKYRWDHAEETLVTIGDNQAAAKLFLELKNYLIEQLEAARKKIEAVTEMKPGDALKSEYFKFIDEKLEMLKLL